MKTTVAVVLLSLAFVGSALAEPCDPKRNSLPAPQNLLATADADSVDASWDALVGATKYSVVVIAHYAGCTLEQSFSFSVVDPSISVPLADLTTCIDELCTGGPISPEGVSVKVKGLNPPKGKAKLAQCSPYSDTATVDFCGDGVDGDCDGTIDEGCVVSECARDGEICDVAFPCGGDEAGCLCFATPEGGTACAPDACPTVPTFCNSAAECPDGGVCVINCCFQGGYCTPGQCLIP